MNQWKKQLNQKVPQTMTLVQLDPQNRLWKDFWRTWEGNRMPHWLWMLSVMRRRFRAQSLQCWMRMQMQQESQWAWWMNWGTFFQNVQSCTESRWGRTCYLISKICGRSSWNDGWRNMMPWMVRCVMKYQQQWLMWRQKWCSQKTNCSFDRGGVRKTGMSTHGNDDTHKHKMQQCCELCIHSHEKHGKICILWGPLGTKRVRIAHRSFTEFVPSC